MPKSCELWHRQLGLGHRNLVKRLCYKDSIDAQVIELHAKIRSGAISIVDNLFPPEAVDVLRTKQPAAPAPAPAAPPKWWKAPA